MTSSCSGLACFVAVRSREVIVPPGRHFSDAVFGPEHRSLFV